MTKLLSCLDIPTLPLDILRLVFEEAIRCDKHKAIKYALISKLVCDWVEICLYEEVRLYSEKSLRKFLRTLESSTKPKQFFTTRVKSLAMAYDIHDLKRMTRVLSVCSGVRNLTIWAIPSSQISLDTQLNPNFYPPTSYELRSSSQSVAGLQNLTNKLRPQRLAVLLDKPLQSLDVIHDPDSVEWTAAHPFSNFSPNFFSHLTHLSIVNRWTEWSTWFLMPPGYSSSSHTTATVISHERSLNPLRLFPRLTHLSLEIRVSNRSVTQQRGFTSLLPFPRYEGDNTLTHCVSRALTEILTTPELSSKLQVLLCILSFDDLPFLTARKIREQTFRGLNTTFGKERAQAPRSPFSVPAHPESDCWEPAGFTESSLGDRHCHLVFAHDREPFREREAGSWKVFNMWRLAEEMVCRQKQERVLDSYVDPIVFRI